ncbi:MAG TPA: hypothetical protein DD706_17230 [Nitrospiraceae bacterium]|nr:hypothetical protein [Nitrospiraceae bacterium]
MLFEENYQPFCYFQRAIFKNPAWKKAGLLAKNFPKKGNPHQPKEETMKILNPSLLVIPCAILLLTGLAGAQNESQLTEQKQGLAETRHELGKTQQDLEKYENARDKFDEGVTDFLDDRARFHYVQDRYQNAKAKFEQAEHQFRKSEEKFRGDEDRYQKARDQFLGAQARYRKERDRFLSGS